jgi:hypothetical protein
LQRATAEVEKQREGLPPAEIEKRRQRELLMQSSYQDIDGKRTPELVPYQIRMQHFFARYESGQFEEMLAPQLSTEDRAILAHFSKLHSAELKKQQAAYDAEWLAIGARASSMNAQELAGALKAATLKSENAVTAMYRDAINSLSPEGRQRVLDFAFVHVRPQVAIEDPFVVANGDPEFFKDQVVKAYEMRRTGQVPPPPAVASKAATSFAGQKSKATTDTVTDDSKLGSTPVP